MSLVIPRQPDALHLLIEKEWNGNVCSDDRLRARFAVSQVQEGVRVVAEAPVLEEQKIPEAAVGARVDKLWEYDVAELFLVGPGHQYLEVELGAGGHWLIFGFDAIRQRRDEYKDFVPAFSYKKTEGGTWMSEIIIPFEMVPENIRALNAFAILSGRFLAYAEVPGKKPDFHQPDFFPKAILG